LKKSLCPQICLVFVATLLTIGATAQDSLVLPAQTFTDVALLQNFKDELQQKQYVSASAALQTLLSHDASQLMSDGEGTLISIDAWIDSLPAEQQARLRDAFDGKFHEAAATKLQLPAKDFPGKFDALYAVAHQWRFCLPGAAAYADAADMATQRDDLAASQTLYSLALRYGWTPDDSHRTQLQALQHLPKSSLPSPLAFDAGWYGATPMPAVSFFPVADDRRIFVCGLTGALALQSSGDLAWSNLSRSRNSADHAGIWMPSVFSDVAGGARIVVYRRLQPNPAPDRPHRILQACSAADGKLRWSTDTQPLTADLDFVGVPAVCGGYVYCLAQSVGHSQPPQRTELMVAAIDALNGQLRWQQRIASLSNQTAALAGGLCGCDDAVYITPSVGFLGCLDRFDGQIRWLRRYATASSNRWRGISTRCGTVLITAPIDSAEVIGLNADTGKQMWTIADSDATLIGDAVLAKPKSILAIDPQNGKTVWQWQPPADGRITGPPALRGQSVIVPSDAGMITLNISDGKSTHTDQEPSLAAVLRNPTARKMLHDLGAESFLSVPTSQPITP